MDFPPLRSSVKISLIKLISFPALPLAGLLGFAAGTWTVDAVAADAAAGCESNPVSGTDDAGDDAAGGTRSSRGIVWSLLCDDAFTASGSRSSLSPCLELTSAVPSLSVTCAKYRLGSCLLCSTITVFFVPPIFFDLLYLFVFFLKKRPVFFCFLYERLPIIILIDYYYYINIIFYIYLNELNLIVV